MALYTVKRIDQLDAAAANSGTDKAVIGQGNELVRNAFSTLDLSATLAKATGAANTRTLAEHSDDKPHIFDQIPTAQHAGVLAGTASAYDAGPDINTLLAQAVTSGAKVVRAVGSPYIATTVEPRLGGALDMSGATFKAGANVPLITMRPGGQIFGPGTLWCAGLVYTSTALLIDGGASSATWHEPLTPTIVRGIRAYNGKTHLAEDSAYFTGTGFKLTAQSGGRVWGALLDGCKAHGFERNLYLLGTGTGWVNGNDILAFLASYGVYQIVLDGETNNCDANVISAQAQPALGDANCERNLIVNGAQNRIDFQSWDWTGGTAGDFAIEFQEDGKRNRLSTNEHPIRVSGWRRAKLEDSNVVDFLSYGVPVSEQTTYPPSKDFQTYSGAQDNLLAWGSVIGGITQTAGASPSSGILFNVTDLDGQTGAIWNDDTPPIALEFAFPATEPYFQAVCVDFILGRFATSVKIEVYDGSYTTKLDITGNASARVSFEEDNHHLNVTKIRLTFSGFASGETTIHLARVSAFGTIPGRAFLSSVNPKFYGVPNAGGGLSAYADDAAAAVGGLAIGDFYRTASAVKVRVA